ncbi:hypothetical protein CCP2SC5_950012 [Azospirillaceae bacterium]
MQRGRLRGLGLSSYIECSAGGGPEQAVIEVSVDGAVTVMIGAQSNGQGHETAYKQIVCERLGVDPDVVTIVQGDTDRVAWGAGTDGSRSIPVGGAAIAECADKILETMRKAAADAFGVAIEAIEFRDGAFSAVGSNHWVELRGSACAASRSVEKGKPVFMATARWRPPANTYPNGTHVCEVEIDPETGAVEIVAYSVADDFGTVLNPRLVAGQVHGGVVQGIGQALFEACVFDSDSGQLLTGSFSDYALPRAEGAPFIRLHLNSVPCRTNLLGMKGAGEAGAIGAPPTVINAIVDALHDLGVEHVDMPATPLSLWRLMSKAQRKP